MFRYFLDFYVNHRFGTAFILTEVLFILSVVVLANRIQPTLRGIGKLLLHAVGVFVFVILGNGFLYWFNNTSNPGIWHPLGLTSNIYILTIVLYFALFSKYKWSTRILLATVYYSAFYSIMNISEAFGYIMRVEYGIDNMTSVFQVAVDILLAAYLYTLNFDEYSFTPTINFVLMIVTSALTFVIVRNSVGAARKDNALAESCLLMIQMLTYYMFYSVAKQYNNNVMRQVVSDKRAGGRDLVLAMRANQDNVHTVIHDFKNQLATLKQLIADKEYDRADEFLQQLELFSTPAIEAVDSGNVVVDAALTMEKAKADKNHVKLNTMVAVPPVLKISDSDIVSILCNLLDNAIEACVREGTQQQGIYAEVKYMRNYLFITVKNTVNDTLSKSERLKLHSSKNSFTHGYGTKIVRTLAEKHDGAAKFDLQDNTFVASVMLALPTQETTENNATTGGTNG